jgi:TPR repeat protein
MGNNDLVCSGHLMMVLSGKVTPSIIPKDEKRAQDLALKVSEALLSKIAQERELNRYEQHILGWMYGHGEGVTKDEAKAFQWYLRAAEQGYAVAQSNVGYGYSNGEGVAKDQAKAFQWYLRAAEQGYAVAQSNVGSGYDNGKGVAKDQAKAFQWYLRAADQGNAAAQARVRALQEGRS